MINKIPSNNLTSEQYKKGIKMENNEEIQDKQEWPQENISYWEEKKALYEKQLNTVHFTKQSLEKRKNNRKIKEKNRRKVSRQQKKK